MVKKCAPHAIELLEGNIIPVGNYTCVYCGENLEVLKDTEVEIAIKTYSYITDRVVSRTSKESLDNLGSLSGAFDEFVRNAEQVDA